MTAAEFREQAREVDELRDLSDRFETAVERSQGAGRTLDALGFTGERRATPRCSCGRPAVASLAVCERCLDRIIAGFRPVAR